MTTKVMPVNYIATFKKGTTGGKYFDDCCSHDLNFHDNHPHTSKISPAFHDSDHPKVKQLKTLGINKVNFEDCLLTIYFI